MAYKTNNGIQRRDLLKTAGFAAGGLAAATGLSLDQRRAQAAPYQGPIRLLANENPYGPSPKAQEAMAANLSNGWMYAGAEIRALRTLIAEQEGVEEDHIQITAGSGELLRMTGAAYAQTGEIVAARPTFSMLVSYAKTAGGTVHEVDLDETMTHDLAAMESRVTDRTSLVYVCNPNNPTGTLLNGDELRAFIDAVQGRATVFVDEAYVDLLDDRASNAMVDQIKAGKNVIVARTFSKIHGMAGLRVGYAIARPDLIKRIRSFQMSFLNILSMKAAAASYQDADFQAFSRSKIKECMGVAEAVFDDLGLPYTQSFTNFVMFDTGGSVRDLGAAMRQKNILVGRSYAPYTSWCRLSMGTVEHMAQFADALRAYYKA